MSTDFRDDDDALAAEYALGLLQGAERDEVRVRMARDGAFSAQVTEWEIRLATLADDLETVAPSPATKAVLMTGLFPKTVPLPLWQRVWLWQGISLACLALLALLWVIQPSGPNAPAGSLYTAEIVSDSGDFRVVAVVDKARNEVILTRTLGSAPAGRILQVWAHGEGEPTISVGLWPEGETVRLSMPAEIAAVEGILTLGVSEEPPGGSPTGLPSGRVFGTVDIPGVTSAL